MYILKTSLWKGNRPVAKTLKILTYNIHKASTWRKFNSTLHRIRDLLRELDCDLIFMQEVHGSHRKLEPYGIQSQFQFLAEEVWHHYSYAKNVVYDQGDHGNVILSKFPILAWNRIDISTNPFEKRGLLHCKLALTINEELKTIHLYCVHLNIAQGRQEQYQNIFSRINTDIKPVDSVILAGDFNDWNQKSQGFFAKNLDFREAFLDKNGRHVHTYPAMFPFLALDRVYYRNLDLVHCEELKKKKIHQLSDHLPLYCEFKIA